VLPVDIIGVNQPQYGMDPTMFGGKPLSWIRDNFTVNMSAAWGVAYRDTLILDPRNEKIETYNLTTYDLTVPANKATLKAKLQAAATPADTDNDKLPDYWERWAYGNLSRSPATTGPDGLKTLLHYAHCSPPPVAGVLPALPRMVVLGAGSGTSASVIWTRRRGTAFGLEITPEFSANLAAWTDGAHSYEDWSSRTLYDGSAGEVIEWRATLPNPFRFARLRVALP